MDSNRNWDVLLIGGASGVGKTKVSLPLARYYGVDLVRVDDFQVLLEAMTTPDVFPGPRFDTAHPNDRAYEAEDIVAPLIHFGRSLTPGLIAVVEDHIAEKIPMIMEGDFILPELATSFDNPRIRSVFIYEPSKEQILQNYLAREGTLQYNRTEESYVYGNWLKDNCYRSGLPILDSRPWDTLMERLIAELT